MANSKKFDTGKYDFIGKAKYVIPAWILVMVIGIFAIFTKGLIYGIDFAGGTEIQVQFQKPASAEEVRKMVDSLGYGNASIQRLGENNEFLIRIEAIEGQTDKETNELQNLMIAKITTGFASSFADNSAEIRRVDSVGPQVGEELKRNSILAAIYSLILILIYVAMRFDYKYAPAAVFCLLHDAVVMVSIFSIFGREVNVQTLAAILTLIGYSLNDTIINFDRIRENEKLYYGEPFTGIVNRSINDVLSRTILTGVTTELAVLSLYFLSDGVIRDIAFTLSVGIVFGTLSSIYISNPFVIYLHNYFQARSEQKLRTAKV